MFLIILINYSRVYIVSCVRSPVGIPPAYFDSRVDNAFIFIVERPSSYHDEESFWISGRSRSEKKKDSEMPRSVFRVW